nr:porin [uncultured Hyphomonas sp.]
MKRQFLLALVSAAAYLPALAQEDWDVWETDWEKDGALLFAPGAEEAVLYRLGLGFDTNRVLDNGLVLGAAARLDAELDHPARAGFSGIIADPAPGEVAVAGGFSGLARSSGLEDDGARAVLQTAYIYVEGGYGEARLGRDEGVAKRFAQGAPSLFSSLSLNAPRLDPDGGAIVRTDHDLTGPAAKASFTTPRIVGFKGGISYTPEADVRGLDRDPVRILPGTAATVLTNAAEASVSFNHRFRESGVRVRASTGWSRADVDAAPTAPAPYNSVETWSFGASTEWKDTVIGASWQSSDNGLDGLSGDYTAWTAGLTHTAFGLDWGVEYGEASDDAVGVEGESWRAGVARSVADTARIAVGYRSDQLDFGAYAQPRRLGGEGIVIEITLSH